MTDGKEPYYNYLVAFKQVSQSVFGTQLHPIWREHLHKLMDTLHDLTSFQEIPMAPKMHVLTVYVEQWINKNGHAIGKPSITPGRG